MKRYFLLPCLIAPAMFAAPNWGVTTAQNGITICPALVSFSALAKLGVPVPVGTPDRINILIGVTDPAITALRVIVRATINGEQHRFVRIIERDSQMPYSLAMFDIPMNADIGDLAVTVDALRLAATATSGQ